MKGQGIKKPPLPESTLAEAFERALEDGVSYSRLAADYRRDRATFTRALLAYKPYAEWLYQRRKNPTLRYEDLRSMLIKGFTIRHIAELFDFTYDEMVADVRKLEAADGRKYLSDNRHDTGYKHYITVYDVEVFKRKVQVGELLVCSETEDGIIVYCKVLKKHNHFATTDMGAIQWNWLCVKNERRLYNDEIIYP